MILHTTFKTCVSVSSWPYLRLTRCSPFDEICTIKCNFLRLLKGKTCDSYFTKWTSSVEPPVELSFLNIYRKTIMDSMLNSITCLKPRQRHLGKLSFWLLGVALNRVSEKQSDCSLNAPWKHSDCSLNAPWKHSDCSLSASWVLPECFLSALWVLM